MTPTALITNDPDGIALFLEQTRASFDRACAIRDDYLPLWQDCYAYTIPESARFTGTMTSPSKAYTTLYDGTAPDAMDQLAASLLANLTPPWTNWFAIEPGPAANDEATTADITSALQTSTQVLQDQIDRSNLYTELHQCFLDLVVGGTACLALAPTPIGTEVRFQAEAIPLYDIILGADPRGALTQIYRRRLVTPPEIIALRQRFAGRSPLSPSKTTNSAGDPDRTNTSSTTLNQDSEYIEIIEFYIFDRGTHWMGAMTQTPHDDTDLIYLIPVEQSPYILFRWQKSPGVPFGRSPVMKALPDIKCANTVVELILKNASIATTGIWQAEDDGVLNINNIKLTPGTIIPKAPGSAGLQPLEMPARFDVSQLVLDDLRARIRHALLADRFAAIETPRMTATEVRQRTDEAMNLLGAIYGRLQGELLTPLLTHLYDMMRSMGEIADIPLDGRIAQITHQSPLARLHAQRGIDTTLTLIDSVNRIGGKTPELVQNIQTVRYLAEILGVPGHLIQHPTTPDASTDTP